MLFRGLCWSPGLTPRSYLCTPITRVDLLLIWICPNRPSCCDCDASYLPYVRPIIR